jgi:thioesterase domain-containing protein
MASCYVEEIREYQPEGPYLISGWSLGGLIAMDVARQLHAAGARVPLLVMYDTHLHLSRGDVPEMSHAALLLRIASRLRIPIGQLQALAPQQQWDWIAERAAQSAGAGVEEMRNLAETCRAHLAAMARFQPKAYTGLVTLFRTAQARQALDPRWAEICPRLRVAQVPGNHYTMLEEPHVDVLAAQLDAELAAALAAEHPRS